MTLVVTLAGRYRIGIHRVNDRFSLERRTSVERTEAHPDGHIDHFVVHDRSDGSKMTIDEEDAEQLEALWQGVICKSIAPEAIGNHLQWLFDVKYPPESNKD